MSLNTVGHSVDNQEAVEEGGVGRRWTQEMSSAQKPWVGEEEEDSTQDVIGWKPLQLFALLGDAAITQTGL